MRSMERVAAIGRKEFWHLFRDWRVLAAVLVVPILELLLFSYAISFDVKNVPTVVVDCDATPASRAYVDAYRTSSFFHVIGSATSVESTDTLFDGGAARIVVVVQPGFERALAAGEKAPVGVLIDGSEPNAAKTGQAYALALNQAYGQQIAATWADRHGVDTTSFGRLGLGIRTWYNPERSSSNFLIPGLMVAIIMVVTVQQTAVSLVRERDLHTQEQMLISPLRLPELMVGKLLPWTLLAFADLVVIVGLGRLVFDVPLRGSFLTLAVGAGLFVFCSLGLGLLVSALAPSLESANVLAVLLSFLPAFLLSGFAFPLESTPLPLQWLSCLFPARFMVTLSRAVFLKGAGFTEVTGPLLSLVAYAVVVLCLAVWAYGRRMRR